MKRTGDIGSDKMFALVTGASYGLGRAIAFELARQQVPLLLTALPQEGLPALANEIGKQGVEVHFFETDLSKKENIQLLANWANRFRLFTLINNAGRGGTKRLLDTESDYLESIIQLNITAPSLLTHQLLPNLMKSKASFILNVGSMAALIPIGYKTVYPGSKRFIQHFSLGLREELKGTGVSVSVLLPGAMKTNEDATRRIEMQGFWGKLGLLPTERIAEIAVKQMFRKIAIIIPGRANMLSGVLLRFLPQAWAIGWLTKTIRKEIHTG